MDESRFEKKLKESKEIKDSDDKKVSMALFKARMASEANNATIEDKYITNCYLIMREFKYTQKDVMDMNISHFDILLEEMIAQSKREEIGRSHV
mgnify:CR=1 FL=1